MVEQHDTVLNDNLPKENHGSRKSPHLLVTGSFDMIKDNCIILHKPQVSNGSSQKRKIWYKIDTVGKCLCFKRRKNYLNLAIDHIKKNSSTFWLIIKVLTIWIILGYMQSLGKGYNQRIYPKI